MEQEIADNESVSTAVVYAVSDVVGRDPVSLPPLANVIDPDALDTLFRPWNGDGHSRGHVSFRYANCRVTVDDGEQVTVDQLDATAADGSGRQQADAY